METEPRRLKRGLVKTSLLLALVEVIFTLLVFTVGLWAFALFRLPSRALVQKRKILGSPGVLVPPDHPHETARSRFALGFLSNL